jgi:TonB-linked SusC/RagA family outer membrane protein
MKEKHECLKSICDLWVFKLLKSIGLSILMLLISANVMLGNVTQQQTVTVSGKVTDAQTGDPLPGVNIVVQGTTTGTTSDMDGNYTIEAPADATLVYSFVGYQSETASVEGREEINVTLRQQVTELEEVVAIGYGYQQKKEVVGSVTSVRGDRLAETPSADVTNALSGRLPGVTIMQPTGEPGNNAANINVRGRTTLHGTSPLVVIDGVPGRSLSEVDPADIDDISVLKDASAAIYGASAANGVILVTTKRGQSEKPRLQIDSYQGFMTPTIIPDICSSAEYATMLSEYQMYQGSERRYTNRDIELFRSGEDPWEHPNTRWMDDLIADWTTRSKHSATLDGTFNNINYYFSLGLKNEEAIYEQESTSYTQYNARAKLDVPITDWMTVSYDFAGFQTEREYPTRNAFAIYGQATRLVPTMHSFWPNGKPGPDIEYGDNPVVTSSFETGHDDEKHYKTQNTFRLQLNPLEKLNFEARYSYDLDNRYDWFFQQPWILYFPNWETAEDTDGDGFIDDMELIPTPRGEDAPQMTEEYHRGLRELANIRINYSRDFGNHTISLLGAVEQLNNDGNYIEAYRNYYISDKIQTLDAGAEREKDNAGGRWIYSRRSFIGRFSYNYMEKYLAEFAFRRDGSMKYPPDSRWGNFPSVMLGWRISEENFWQEAVPFVNYLKLKASYGRVGMDPGDPFQYLNKYAIGKGAAFGPDKSVESMIYQEGVANPDITWEKETSYNVGFESQFLNNKFNLDLDLFYKKRSDILAFRDASVPELTGLTLPQENIAEVDNRGFEIEAGYNAQFGQDLRMSISGNISYNKNEVVYMDEPQRSVPWQEREGKPYGVTLLYEAIGVFKDQQEVDDYPSWPGAKPGDIKFRDVDDNGIIDADDQILLDRTESPRTFYGITFDLAYKNWNFSMLIQGQGTYYQRHTSDARRGEAGNWLGWSYDNRWTQGGIPGVEENFDTNVPRAWNRSDQYWSFSVNDNTYWWDNMAYTRLKNVVLSYNIPTDVIGGAIGLSNASIFIRGNNLFLISSVQRNFDPEVGNPLTYPPTRTIAMGLHLTF